MYDCDTVSALIGGYPRGKSLSPQSHLTDFNMKLAQRARRLPLSPILLWPSCQWGKNLTATAYPLY